MDKDENIIALLENGTITKGEVTKRFYQHVAPAGWKIIYKFDAEAATTDGERAYWGSAQGPRKYYISLDENDPVTIIYNATNPKVNCEIRYFLNNPNYRHTFQKSGKLELLDMFKNEYEIEDYSFKEWYRLQQRE